VTAKGKEEGTPANNLSSKTRDKEPRKWKKPTLK